MERQQPQLDVRQLGLPAAGLRAAAASARRALSDAGGLHVPFCRGGDALRALPGASADALQCRSDHLAGCRRHRLLLLLRRCVRRFAVRVVRLGDCRGVVCRGVRAQLPLQDILEPRQEAWLPPQRAVRFRSVQEIGRGDKKGQVPRGQKRADAAPGLL